MNTSVFKHCLGIYFLSVILYVFLQQNLMAEKPPFIIDDRSTDHTYTVSGNEWRLVTDNVMGGVSEGGISNDSMEGRQCLRMQGAVKLDNNGGFIQVALKMPEEVLKNISSYTGLTLDIYGNDEDYNLHLRTKDNWLPWQAYRATFHAASKWKTIQIPFAEFKPYRTRKGLNLKKLKRIGLVAIGREFRADLCIGKVGFYQ